MAAISAKLVKELRDKTAAGMMDCKKALTETEGDIEKAIEFLRKSGALKAAKKSERVTAEGIIEITQQDAVVSLLEVNCETDFVSKNEDFLKFVEDLNHHILKQQVTDVESVMQQDFQAGKTVEQALNELIAVIGENLTVRRFEVLKAAAGESLASYTHMGAKIGALVKVKGDATKLSEETLKGLAMHVAAANPTYLNPAAIPDSVREKEKEILTAQLKKEGKPDAIIEKILIGKIKKFEQDVSFTEQIFVCDPGGKSSVSAFIKKIDSSAEILAMTRYQVGEGIEKKEDNFAEEVAKMQ